MSLLSVAAHESGNGPSAKVWLASSRSASRGASRRELLAFLGRRSRDLSNQFEKSRGVNSLLALIQFDDLNGDQTLLRHDHDQLSAVAGRIDCVSSPSAGIEGPP